MKKILGLDIGVNSVGYALIKKDDQNGDISFIKTGVRIVNEDPDFHGKFYQGNPASKNASRRTKRMIRRSYQRFKDRRDKLHDLLKRKGMFPSNDLLKISQNDLFLLRARAVHEKLKLEEIGRILIHLNQKRGYKSNRKAQNEESDSTYLSRVMELGKLTENITVGEFWNYFLLYKSGVINDIPEDLYEWFNAKTNEFTNFRIRENIFPRKSFLQEFDRIWEVQASYYPEILSGMPGNTIIENRKTSYNKIRNEIIFYQRPLKSQKHLISECSFEKHHKVAPKSSPLFQEFRIWQQINNLEIKDSHGNDYPLNDDQRSKLFKALHDPSILNAQGKLSFTKILKVTGFPARNYYVNFNLLEGNKTYVILHNALTKAGIDNPEQYLTFSADTLDDKIGLWGLWHLTYSVENEDNLITALIRRFDFTYDQSQIIAQSAGYTSDFGSLSSRAIRKLLSYLEKGLKYYDACVRVGYENPEHIKPDEFSDFLDPVSPNELRNPVVEQVLNQVINVMNNVIRQYGKPDEVRVELARELKSNAQQRKDVTRLNRELRRYNDLISNELLNNYGFRRVSTLDLLRYRLWEETGKRCLYSGRNIEFTQVFNGESEIEHILPYSRTFNDASTNKILVFSRENKLKDQQTAYDYMASKGDVELQRYVDEVNHLYQTGYMRMGNKQPAKISKAKWKNLLCKGEDIPEGFIDRQIKDTQYISKEILKRLKKCIPKVTATSGTVTDFLRERWKLVNVMQEMNFEKYRKCNRTRYEEITDEHGNVKMVERIIDWSKRDDHRHHAVDAIIVALTTQALIQKLNNLNQEYESYRELKQSPLDVPEPVENLRLKVKEQLETILISFKKPNSKVITPKINKTKTRSGIKTQVTWVPRGSLHEDTIFGQIQRYKKVPLNKKFNPDWVEFIPDDDLRSALSDHLLKHNNKAVKAFADGFNYNGIRLNHITLLEKKFSKRVEMNENITSAQIGKIIDPVLRHKIEERIKYKGSIKAAFTDYLHDPVYLDEERTIPVKRVSVYDEGNLVPVRNGFAYTKGNHHALIYEDDNGKYRERIVTFWEAAEIALHNIRERNTPYPIIDRSDKPGLKFCFSLQINDLFVYGLNPEEIDFFDPINRVIISQYLFRLQKLSSGDYFFRHQYETNLINSEEFALKRIQTLAKLKGFTKVRLNNLGDIIKIGE